MVEGFSAEFWAKSLIGRVTTLAQAFYSSLLTTCRFSFGVCLEASLLCKTQVHHQVEHLVPVKDLPKWSFAHSWS